MIPGGSCGKEVASARAADGGAELTGRFHHALDVGFHGCRVDVGLRAGNADAVANAVAVVVYRHREAADAQRHLLIVQGVPQRADTFQVFLQCFLCCNRVLGVLGELVVFQKCADGLRPAEREDAFAYARTVEGFHHADGGRERVIFAGANLIHHIDEVVVERAEMHAFVDLRGELHEDGARNGDDVEVILERFAEVENAKSQPVFLGFRVEAHHVPRAQGFHEPRGRAFIHPKRFGELGDARAAFFREEQQNLYASVQRLNQPIPPPFAGSSEK
ncbi:hypothetical protein SDC9_70836 [bioreactor metagenome]|uniref:Uncharacterized protein n=1 Tax=bioreactor metagenome TaxID=1076179 RepID=A0A644YDX4_9ZZZZ